MRGFKTEKFQLGTSIISDIVILWDKGILYPIVREIAEGLYDGYSMAIKHPLSDREVQAAREAGR